MIAGIIKSELKRAIRVTIQFSGGFGWRSFGEDLESAKVTSEMAKPSPSTGARSAKVRPSASTTLQLGTMSQHIRNDPALGNNLLMRGANKDKILNSAAAFGR